MLLTVVVMKKCMIVFKALAWCKADQELQFADVVHPRGDLITVVWLDGYNIKLSSYRFLNVE